MPDDPRERIARAIEDQVKLLLEHPSDPVADRIQMLTLNAAARIVREMPDDVATPMFRWSFGIIIQVSTPSGSLRMRSCHE